MATLIQRLRTEEPWNSRNVDTWKEQVTDQVNSNTSRITTSFVGLYDQVADDADPNTPGNQNLTAATNYARGDYFTLSVTGAFTSTLPELAGKSGAPGDQLISDGAVWLLLEYSGAFLSSVAADTAAGVITFTPAPKSSTPASVGVDLMRKQESDASDAALQGNIDTVQSNLDAHVADALPGSDVHGAKAYTDDAPRAAGAWTWAGAGTGLPAGGGSFRSDSTNFGAVTSLRFDPTSADGIGLENPLGGLLEEDYIYLKATDPTKGGGLYVLTEDPTQPGGAGTDVLYSNLTPLNGTGTLTAGDRVIATPIYTAQRLDRSSALGYWFWEGGSTAVPAGDGGFTTDSSTISAITEMRLDAQNDSTADVSAALINLDVGDLLYFRSANEGDGAGLYELTQPPTQAGVGNDVILSGLVYKGGAGTLTLGDPAYMLPIHTQALTRSEIGSHVAQTDIHFADVPIDGVAYSRQDQLWVQAPKTPSFAYLASGGISGAWNTTLKTITGYSDSNSTLDMAAFLNPSAGYIEIPAAGVWEVQATVTGNQGNNTKEESMRLWVQYRDGPTGNLDVILDVFAVSDDKTSDRAFAFSYKRPLQIGDRVYLAVNATAGMGTFSFDITSLEVTSVLT